MSSDTPTQIDEELVDALLARELRLARETTPLAPGLPEVDLRTLAGALTALRREIRAETQAVRAVREHSRDALADLDASVARLVGQHAALARKIDELRAEAAQQGLQALIDIADRLDATARVVSRPRAGAWLPWGRRARARLASIEDGLRLTQERIAEHLAAARITRLQVIGRGFDAALMEAVDRVQRADVPEGTVVDEIAAGYRCGDRVLRPARVVVAYRA